MKTLIANDIKAKGMRALARELGAAGMAQFMQQFNRGRGDYSKDRHKILDKLTVDDIFAAIKAKRQTR